MKNRKFMLKWRHPTLTNVLSCHFVPSDVYRFEVSSSPNEQLLSRDHCPSNISLPIRKKERPEFSFILPRYENKTSDAHYILEILKYFNATRLFRCKCCSMFVHPYTQHVRPALCFCYSCTKVIDTTALLNSGHAWAPVCNVCGEGGQMGYGRGMEKPRATGGEVCYISQGSRRLFTDIGLGLTER
jgi:hypothetical protein